MRFTDAIEYFTWWNPVISRNSEQGKHFKGVVVISAACRIGQKDTCIKIIEPFLIGCIKHGADGERRRESDIRPSHCRCSVQIIAGINMVHTSSGGFQKPLVDFHYGIPGSFVSVDQIIRSQTPRVATGIVGVIAVEIAFEVIGIGGPGLGIDVVDKVRKQTCFRAIIRLHFFNQVITLIHHVIPSGIVDGTCKSPEMIQNEIRSACTVLIGAGLNPVAQFHTVEFLMNITFRCIGAHYIVDDQQCFLKIVDLSLASPLCMCQQQSESNVNVAVGGRIRTSGVDAVRNLFPCHQVRHDVARVCLVIPEEPVEISPCIEVVAGHERNDQHPVADGFRNRQHVALIHINIILVVFTTIDQMLVFPSFVKCLHVIVKLILCVLAWFDVVVILRMLRKRIILCR